MSNDKETKTVEGRVTAFYPSEDENDPHNVYVDTEDGRFSTFHDDTVAEIENGAQVRFEAEQNNGHWNIVKDSVEIIDNEESEVYGDTDGDVAMFSMGDARIISQSVTRSAVLHHQERDDSTVEDVKETARELADLQVELFQKLREPTLEGDKQ